MMSSAQHWIEREFADVSLGDRRLDARMRAILVDLSRHCSKTLSRTFSGELAPMKAAYRFFDNARVSIADMLAPHVRRTTERVRASDTDTILAVQDTTCLNYAGRDKTTGLDIIKTAPSGTRTEGLLLHNTMAITPDGRSFGLLDQRFVERKQVHDDGLLTERNDARPIEDKESRRWLDVITDVGRMDLGDRRVVHVTDREGDIYELFRDAAASGEHVLVRACDNRVIDKTNRSEKAGCWLFDDLMSRRAQGTTSVRVQVNGKKKFRTAKLSIVYRSISLPAPQAKTVARNGPLPNIELTAIMAIEKSASTNPRDKLCWVLLTDLPVNSVEEAIEKVDWYGQRWLIEVFHKVLKSGCKVESAQLGDGERLKRFVIAKSVVAWRLFWMRRLREQDREAGCDAVLAPEEWKLLYRRTHKTKTVPDVPPSVGEALLWIAKLGGYLNRKSDPEPGVISLWRGWERLNEMVEDYRAICGES